MKKILFSIVLMTVFCAFAISAQEYSLRSPNGKAEVRLKIADKVYYSLVFNGQTVVSESAISLNIKENPAVSMNPKVADKKERTVNEIVTAVVPQKRRKIKDNFNELTLNFNGGYSLVWRVYDSGAADFSKLVRNSG